MFFVLSKILEFLFMPITWITGLFLCALLVKSKTLKKRFNILALLMLMFFTNPFITTSIMRWWEVKPTPLNELKNHDVALVFSGITIWDKEPHDRIYFNKGSDRIMMAVHLYKIGKVKKIMISGGSGTVRGEDQSEAIILKDFLLMLGIPEADIIQEKEARNSYENALLSKKIIDEKYKGAKVLLITSGYHMRRCVACCKKVGFDVEPFAGDYYTLDHFNTPADIFLPDAYSFYKWDVLIHEWVGFLAYWLTGKV